MSSSLNDLIKKNLDANERLLNRGKQKAINQEVKEFNLKMKLKKGFVYGAVISTLLLGIYGTNHYWHKCQDYTFQQKKKIVDYQKNFDDVKYYYNNRDYLQADELSEKLKEEMGKEWFFSPANDLYKKVKEYDKNFIDPEVKRIQRERFYNALRNFPRNVFPKLEERWDNSTPNERLVVYACGAGLLIYFLRKRR